MTRKEESMFGAQMGALKLCVKYLAPQLMRLTVYGDTTKPCMSGSNPEQNDIQSAKCNYLNASVGTTLREVVLTQPEN